LGVKSDLRFSDTVGVNDMPTDCNDTDQWNNKICQGLKEKLNEVNFFVPMNFDMVPTSCFFHVDRYWLIVPGQGYVYVRASHRQIRGNLVFSKLELIHNVIYNSQKNEQR
jgi:hypothetical protein